MIGFLVDIALTGIGLSVIVLIGAALLAVFGLTVFRMTNAVQALTPDGRAQRAARASVQSRLAKARQWAIDNPETARRASAYWQDFDS